VTATLNEAIRAAAKSILEGMHTCLPGRVESYDWTTRKASIKPLIQRPDAVKGTTDPLPVIPGVPVVFPWAGDASLSYPLKKGHTGILWFSERAMEIWLARGGDAPPGDPRAFDITDGIFMAGLAPFNESGPAEDGASLLLKYGVVKLRMNNGRIAIGNAQAELLDLIDQLLGGLIATTVPTAVGTYPLSSSISGQLAQIRVLLGLLKGTL
jgi:hypothetical protein